MYKLYTREMARSLPDTLFVFGDNMARQGFGGQAAALRGEPNTRGIPTKWRPSNADDAFFQDSDLAGEVQSQIDAAFDGLSRHLREGGEVVWPEDGIGTGLAKLEEKAPQIYSYIQARFLALKKASEIGVLTILLGKGEGRRVDRSEKNPVKVLSLECEEDYICGLVQGASGHYRVRIRYSPRSHHCECYDSRQRGREVGPCKHTLALARYRIELLEDPKQPDMLGGDLP
jgi:hypothetical protein